jgi:crystallin alpha B
MMDRQMNQMWKMMDEMPLPMSRFWEPYYEQTGRGAGSGRNVQVKYNDQVFEVRLNVSHFAPEELNVKIAGERLTISAKHEEKPDEHGYISREFTRQFVIPENVETDSVESQLTTDGYLVIKGKVRGAEDVKERVINIIREEPSKEKSNKEGGKEGEGPAPAV